MPPDVPLHSHGEGIYSPIGDLYELLGYPDKNIKVRGNYISGLLRCDRQFLILA